MIKKNELEDFMSSREREFPVYALNEFCELVNNPALPDDEFMRRIKCFFENNDHHLTQEDQIILEYLLEEE